VCGSRIRLILAYNIRRRKNSDPVGYFKRAISHRGVETCVHLDNELPVPTHLSELPFTRHAVTRSIVPTSMGADGSHLWDALSKAGRGMGACSGLTRP